MEQDRAQNRDRKTALISALLFSAIYLIALPFVIPRVGSVAFLAFSGCSFSDILTTLGASLFCLLALSIPSSFVFSLYFVWSRFLRGNYSHSRRYCWLPIYLTSPCVLFVLIIWGASF